MAKIKHIAMSTQDPDKTAKFYIDVFGMKEIGRIDNPNTSGYYLSDGDLNLAILKFKNDAVAGAERGKGFSGIHHIGFQVDNLEAIAERLATAGSKPRDDVNEALGVGKGEHKYNVEGATVHEVTPIIRLKWWQKILLPDYNFAMHVYHHMHPGVSFANLPNVHAIYQSEGLVDESAVFHGQGSYLRYLVDRGK